MEDSEWRGMYRIGAVAFVIGGVLFIVGIPFEVFLSPIVATGAEVLASVAKQPSFLATASLSRGIADLLLITAILTVYVVLRRTNRPVLVVATAWLGLAIAFDLASQAAGLSLLGLSAGFEGATSDAGHTAYAAAAGGLLGIQRWVGSLDNFLWGMYAVLVGWVMLRGPFDDRIGYLGIGSGIIGMIGCWFFITGFLGPVQIVLGVFLTLAVVLWGVWYILIATRLSRWRA